MKWWWRKKVHISWRIAISCTVFVIGVFVALVIRISPWIGITMLPIVVGSLAFPYVWSIPICIATALLLGIGYGSLHLTNRSVYATYIGTEAMVSGRVKEDIGQTSSGSRSIQIDSVTINGTPLSGSVLVTARQDGGAVRGDLLHIKGKVKEGFGSFPASITVITIVHVERPAFSDIGRIVRDGFAEKVRTVIPDPQASLGIGFLTGQKSALPTDLANALKVAGLTHIVVASGYNLTILVRLARKLLLGVSKYLSAVSSGLMIGAFVMITGISPSMTRAGLVSTMSLLSWYYGHAFHPFVLLPLAAAITVALQPSYVWGDLGWQLSFSAFTGVMIVAPLLQAYFFGPKEPGTFRQILGETIAAHVVTLPIIALSFGTVSNVAIIANILVVPLVPLAMLLTFISGIGALLTVPFIEWVAVPTTWLLGYMTQVATFVTELPWAQSTVALPPLLWAVYGMAVALACLWMWRKTNFNFRTGEPVAV